jgi:hypothetical protein
MRRRTHMRRREFFGIRRVSQLPGPPQPEEAEVARFAPIRQKHQPEHTFPIITPPRAVNVRRLAFRACGMLCEQGSRETNKATNLPHLFSAVLRLQDDKVGGLPWIGSKYKISAMRTELGIFRTKDALVEYQGIEHVEKNRGRRNHPSRPEG